MQSNLSSKIITKGGQTNLSGEANKIKPVKENEGTRKLRPSLIPTRKSNTQKVLTRTVNSFTKKNSNSPYIGQKNIQRVQHLNIDRDIFSGVQSPPKSVAVARPIPTLQHIYREDLSNETFTDWFLESVSECQDVPEDFINSNTTNAETSNVEANSSNTVKIVENNNELKSLNNLSEILKNSSTMITFKSTNENVQDWLSSKLDYPTKDNESGYQSISRPFSLKSKNSCTSKIFGEEKFYVFQNTLLDSSVQKTVYEHSNSGENLVEQPTVVMNNTKKKSLKMNKIYSAIPKLNTDLKLVKKRTDILRPTKFPSAPNPVQKHENKENHPINSYVDYPSEILQKTTNFDANGANSEIQDDISSQHTIEHENEYGIPAKSNTDWSRLQSSRVNSTVGKSSKTSNLTDESWRMSFCDDKNESNSFKNPDKNSCHDYYYHYCWRKEVAKKNKAVQELWDCKGRCRKCQKRRCSPYRKKLAENNVRLIILRSFTMSSVPRSLKNLKRRMSIGRVCRRRWNCVWKKTAERWTNWSKSPYKFRKFGMIYLKKPNKWDDADAQTTVNVYNETGTDAAARERKSAVIIDALKNALSQSKIDLSITSEKNNIFHMRHANVGPSMFRFHTNSSMLIGKSPNRSKMTSYKSLHCQCNSIDANAKESIFSSREMADRKITDCIEGKMTSVENKLTSAMFHLSSMKLDDTVLQDAFTQMMISCNNAETNIKFTPEIDTDFMKVQTSDHFVCFQGVDEGTQALTSNKSQRSIKIMTSKANLQELISKEIQASPVSSIRKISTGIVVQDRLLQDAKSSVVTDTSIPYRRLNNTMMTPKGTILSCTGTKITSVSSVHIQTASVIYKQPKITKSTAVSTDVSTENRGCSTAPSLYLRHLDDVSLGTDDGVTERSEKSTSYAQFTDYINAGISTSNLVNQVSFNGGSYQTHGSFGAAIHPECFSICTNTDVESKTKSTETGGSFERQFELKQTLNKNDCYSQYSGSRKNNQLSNNSANSSHIGRSRLLSVRTLGGSLCESPQAQTMCSSFDKRMKTTQEQSVSASQFHSIDGLCRTSNYIQTILDTGKSDQLKPPPRDVYRNKIKSKQITPSAEPDLVISSNLNAAKWIKGCVNESRRDVQSIINLSESTVTESLERASFAIVNSEDRKIINEMKNLSKVVINQQRAINCVSTKPLGAVSTISVTAIRPIKDNMKSNDQTQPLISNNPSECRNVVVDNNTSGEILTNDATESVQVRPEVRDAATGFDRVKVLKSDFAITSHCLLPKFFCNENIDRNNTVAELLKRMTSEMTSCTLCTHPECCLRCNHSGKIDTSIQAVAEFLACPNCNKINADTLDDQVSIDDIKSHLASNCRYYRNMLAMKLALFKENFQKHLVPSIENTAYHTATIPHIFTEACTMKPSGKTDANCQTKISRNTTKIKNSPSHFLSPAYSLIDIRGNHERDDLKTVYNILTAIEGRVRRIKNNLRA